MMAKPITHCDIAVITDHGPEMLEMDGFLAEYPTREKAWNAASVYSSRDTAHHYIAFEHYGDGRCKAIGAYLAGTLLTKTETTLIMKGSRIRPKGARR